MTDRLKAPFPYFGGAKDGNDNAKRERCWFSPSCLKERTLFDDA